MAKGKMKQTNSTFSVIFVIQKGKCKADGTAPILARITVNGQMIHFSTRQSILPERWLPLEYRTLGQTKEEKEINEKLEDFKSSIKRNYSDLVYRGEVVTAAKLKNELFSLDERSNGVLELFDLFLKDYERMTLTEGYGKESFFRYRVTKDRVAEFLRDEYKCKDYAIADIDKSFLERLFVWLRTTKGNCNNTAVKFIHRFSSVYHLARDKGWVNKNPFGSLRLRLETVDRNYLTKDEIETVYNKQFTSKRLETVRDLFIFSCYTGLAYIDIKQLTFKEIVQKADGRLWIVKKRQKTKTPVTVPLLDIPLMIMEKYTGQGKDDLVFPVISNQKMNDYIKEIIAICDIDKDISFHCARHTFATTVTLENGVPIESVSKMLGHTNIQTTQIYARITNQKIQQDMSELAGKIEGLHESAPEPSVESKNARSKARKTLRAIRDFKAGQGA